MKDPVRVSVMVEGQEDNFIVEVRRDEKQVLTNIVEEQRKEGSTDGTAWNEKLDQDDQWHAEQHVRWLGYEVIEHISWDNIVEWAKTMGKTEHDIVVWWALSDAQSIRDMTDMEMVEWLLEGVKYDVAYVKGQWEQLDTDAQIAFKGYMNDEWGKQS